MPTANQRLNQPLEPLATYRSPRHSYRPIVHQPSPLPHCRTPNLEVVADAVRCVSDRTPQVSCINGQIQHRHPLLQRIRRREPQGQTRCSGSSFERYAIPSRPGFAAVIAAAHRCVRSGWPYTTDCEAPARVNHRPFGIEHPYAPSQPVPDQSHTGSADDRAVLLEPLSQRGHDARRRIVHRPAAVLARLTLRVRIPPGRSRTPVPQRIPGQRMIHHRVDPPQRGTPAHPPELVRPDSRQVDRRLVGRIGHRSRTTSRPGSSRSPWPGHRQTSTSSADSSSPSGEA